MCISRQELKCERHALLIEHEVVLKADFPSVGGITAPSGAPFWFGNRRADECDTFQRHAVLALESLQ